MAPAPARRAEDRFEQPGRRGLPFVPVTPMTQRARRCPYQRFAHSASALPRSATSTSGRCRLRTPCATTAPAAPASNAASRYSRRRRPARGRRRFTVAHAPRVVREPDDFRSSDPWVAITSDSSSSSRKVTVRSVSRPRPSVGRWTAAVSRRAHTTRTAAPSRASLATARRDRAFAAPRCPGRRCARRPAGA